MTADAHDLASESESLDGHTMEQLSDYLDRGRMPADPSIDGSAVCQLALEGLERLRSVSLRHLELEAEAETPPEDGWVTRILGGISLDARAGRDIVLESAPDAEIVLTEGAVRGMVRAAGDRSGSLLIGRVTLDGDVTVPGEPIVVSVEATVFWGERISTITDEVRRRIREALERHTALNVTRIDIRVHDVVLPPEGNSGTGADGRLGGTP